VVVAVVAILLTAPSASHFRFQFCLNFLLLAGTEM
jgi:hypothetical protein